MPKKSTQFKKKNARVVTPKTPPKSPPTENIFQKEARLYQEAQARRAAKRATLLAGHKATMAKIKKTAKFFKAGINQFIKLGGYKPIK